jgi:hypothetical protein
VTFIEIAAVCVALLLAALMFHAWLAAHDDQLRLQSTLATQKEALDAADAREHDRNSTLKDALAQIEALKRSAQTQTPAQLARALQDALHLPQPITITSSDSSLGARHVEDPGWSRGTVPERPISMHTPSTDAAVIPDQGTPDIRVARTSPTLLPSSITQQPSANDAKQGTTQQPKSLFRWLFHRVSPRTTTDAPSSSAVPQSVQIAPHAETPESSALPSARQGTIPATPATSNTPQSATENPPAAEQSTATQAPQSTAEIPAADLARLYNYVQDCRACQLELIAAKQNATDDATKIRALTRERDAAITAAKGGPIWLRLKRNAHWLAIGAAVGAVTSTAALCHTGHCR